MLIFSVSSTTKISYRWGKKIVLLAIANLSPAFKIVAPFSSSLKYLNG